ncbi:MAG TPA: carboxypeptidase-like regulatory domain-containing protein [Planctomycetota bacterium]|nr:carboxypeptidase-like regulatory domain-containing protein [Planctomycetota bacterium]
MALLQAFALGACLMAAGCAAPNLFVVDEEGRPVEGATVTAARPSFIGPVATTDQEGAARIEISSGSSLRPEMLTLSVKKPGYQEVRNIDAQQAQPIRILLRRSAPWRDPQYRAAGLQDRLSSP